MFYQATLNLRNISITSLLSSQPSDSTDLNLQASPDISSYVSHSDVLLNHGAGFQFHRLQIFSAKGKEGSVSPTSQAWEPTPDQSQGRGHGGYGKCSRQTPGGKMGGRKVVSFSSSRGLGVYFSEGESMPCLGMDADRGSLLLDVANANIWGQSFDASGSIKGSPVQSWRVLSVGGWNKDEFQVHR